MKKSVKFLVATVALTAGMLVFSKADSKAAVTGVTQIHRQMEIIAV